MFQSILGRVQSSIENTVDIIFNRALIVLCFVIAAGLVTAAGAHRLAVAYGVETALIAVAALFVVAGLVAASVLKVSDTDLESAEAAASAQGQGQESSSAAFDTLGLPALSEADRDLVMGLLASLAPMFAPRILGAVVRNVPALIVLAIALFLLARQARRDVGVPGVETPAAAE